MTRAILIMLVGMSLIPFGDAASKLLSGTHGVAPLYVAWARFAFGAICVAPFVLRSALPAFRLPLAWVRGVLLAMGISAISTALKTTDIATAFGGLFFAPIFSFVTAAIFLRESVTATRSILICIGFVGVLLVAQPGASFTPGVGFSLIAGTCYGMFLTASRAVAGQAPAGPLLFSQLLIAAVITLPLGIIYWPPMTGQVPMLLVWSGLASTLGNLCLIVAYTLAPATRMAPLVYFQLIAALALGVIIFGQLPNTLALVGLAVIALSGFGTFLLKR